MENKVIEEQIEQSLVVVRTEVASIEELSELRISGLPTLELSADGLKRVGKVLKQIKAEKDKNIVPLRQVIANINEFWKPFEDRISEVEKHLKAEQKKYNDKVIAEKEKAKNEINDAFKSGEVTEKQIEKSGQKLENLEEKSSLIKTYKYVGVKIIDKKLIPLELLDLNESEAKRLMQSGVVVPGCELFEETRIRK